MTEEEHSLKDKCSDARFVWNGSPNQGMQSNCESIGACRMHKLKPGKGYERLEKVPGTIGMFSCHVFLSCTWNGQSHFFVPVVPWFSGLRKLCAKTRTGIGLGQGFPYIFCTRMQIDVRKCRGPHLETLYSLVNALCSYSQNCCSCRLSQHIV